MGSDPTPKAGRIRLNMLDHIQAQTQHARRGTLKNAFSYGVDYVLTDLQDQGPAVFSRNRFNLWSLWDRQHGGPRGSGRGLAWFRDLLVARDFPMQDAQLLLLTQPSYLWFNFNPVSFWIAVVDGTPRAFVAEVNSTFGQRHNYLCAHDDFRPIQRSDALVAEKLMHVSPFQTVAGQYTFNFGFTADKIDIRIDFQNGDQGVLATLNGARGPATTRSLLWAAIRRPLGSARVVALIHWQAVVLYFKRAPFLGNQPEPAQPISQSANLKGDPK